jgi:ATP-dependent helicase/nuclease subunit A
MPEIVAWLERGSTSDRDRADGLRAALASDLPRFAFTAFRRAVLTADGSPPQRLVTSERARSSPKLLARLEEFVEKLRSAESRRRAARAAELCQAVLLVADTVRAEYAATKRARGVLDYDDLIVATKTLLERSEAAEWILFKLDGGIDHILIDEAQDTSPEQWAIVSKLTEEFFAGTDERNVATRTIFAVGDEKQSIFSFQGAEPEQFERFRRYFQEQALAAGREFLNEPLAMSRRSAPEILAFVDAVFSNPETRDGLTSTGKEIRHFAHRARARGRVEFWPAIKPSKEPEPDPQREVDTPSEASPATKLAQRLADEIKSWLDHRLRLPDHEKPIRPGDIMVLLPRRNPFGSLIIRELKDRGIPVAGADRMRLTDEIAILDLLALGRFCLQPRDDLTLASLLRSPFCNLRDEQLLTLCAGREADLWHELLRRQNECQDFTHVHTFLSAMLARADFTPPYEFYAEALVTHGMRKRLLGRLGTEANDSIEEFLSLALAFESANSPSLEGFLDWVERGGAEVKRDMERGRDEVRVMTVHGAKGLEADIVILPDTTTLPQLPSEKGHLLYGPEGIQFPVVLAQQSETVAAAKSAAKEAMLREHRRLLYVALTRARDRLYVCGFENKLGIKDGSWYRLTQGAAERLGALVKRGDETILVIGDIGEQFSLDIEAPRPVTQIPTWVSRAPEERQHPRVIRPSDAIDGDDIAISPRGQVGVSRFRRGLLVHSLLSRLPDVAPSQRESAGRRFLRQHIRDDAETKALLGETLALLGDAQFAQAFAPGSRSEVALTAELPELGPGARVNGRVDRLAVTEDEILIVDFKTNRPPPVREEDVAEIYLAQMALYRLAAAKIFPGRRIACALVWTDGPSLVRLSDEVLAKKLVEIRTRLDRRDSRS